MHASLFRKIGGQHSPLTSALNQILYGADDIIDIDPSRLGLFPRAF